jgi:hypothetical protein
LKGLKRGALQSAGKSTTPDGDQVVAEMLKIFLKGGEMVT